MLSFHAFLIEKFFKGVRSTGWSNSSGYVEVWKNPTPNELVQACDNKPMKKTDEPYEWSLTSPAGQKKYGKGVYYLGGIIYGNNLYVFSRSQGQHDDAYQMEDDKGNRIIKNRAGSIPIYMYYFPATNICALSVSSFSAHYDSTSHLQELLKKAAKHPRLKMFSDVIDANTQESLR